MAHGDAGTQSGGTGQVGSEALGKLLRIDPLDPDGRGGVAYGVPTSNPFTDDASNLDEIYALGFRNPHNFDWQKDSGGNAHLILADIGQNAVEEINLVEKGKNYGWRLREGTRVNVGGGNGNPLAPGMTDTAGFRFPVAQFGHAVHPAAIFGGYVVPCWAVSEPSPLPPWANSTGRRQSTASTWASCWGRGTPRRPVRWPSPNQRRSRCCCWAW